MSIEASSGNIFADLGLPNPEERLAKAELTVRIEEIMEELGLTQEQAAKRMRITQPALSNLLRGDVRGFSMERLFRCLRALDQDVQITVRPKEHAQPRLTVAA